MRLRSALVVLTGWLWLSGREPAVAQAAAPPSSGTPSVNPEGQLQTPDRSGSASVVKAAEAPLHDLNLVRQGIPPVLLAAITDPYARVYPLNCRTIQARVDELTVALGADFDQPVTPQTPSLTTRNGKIAVYLIRVGAESLLPFAGVVRTLSGAQRHDQLIIEAITAGSVRRGYLKGLGEAHQCPPPATPTHFPGVKPPAKDDDLEPLYPIR